MSSGQAPIHPPGEAIDHVIDALTERFPEDREAITAIVHRVYGELHASAAFDTHLISLTQHDAAEELRARQRARVGAAANS